MDGNLSKIFGVEPDVVEDRSLANIKAEALSSEIVSLEKQREYVKSNLVKLIERGMTALNDLNIIANSTEDAKNFKAMTEMIQALADTNVKLLNMEVAHKPKMSDVQEGISNNTSVTNNTVFVGTTKELSKWIDSFKEDKNILDVDGQV